MYLLIKTSGAIGLKVRIKVPPAFLQCESYKPLAAYYNNGLLSSEARDRTHKVGSDSTDPTST